MTDPVGHLESPKSGDPSHDSPRRSGPPEVPRRRSLAWLAWVLVGSVPPLIAVAFLLVDRGQAPSVAYPEALRAHLELVAVYQLDAYRRPEAAHVVELLVRVPRSSPDYIPARDLLARYRWEQERAELEALSRAEQPAPVAPPPPPVPQVVVAAAPAPEIAPSSFESDRAAKTRRVEKEALRVEAAALLAEDPGPTGFASRAASTGQPDDSVRIEATKADGPVAFDAQPLTSPSMEELRAHVTVSKADPSSAATTVTLPRNSRGSGTISLTRRPKRRSTRHVQAESGYRCYIATHGNPETRSEPDYEVRLGSRARVMIDGTEITHLRALREVAYAHLDEAELAPLAKLLGPLPEDVLVATTPFLEPDVFLTLLDTTEGPLLIDPLTRYEECQGETVERTAEFGRGPRAGRGASRLEIPIDDEAWFRLVVLVPPPGGRAIEVMVETEDSSYPALRFGLPPPPPAVEPEAVPATSP